MLASVGREGAVGQWGLLWALGVDRGTLGAHGPVREGATGAVRPVGLNCGAVVPPADLRLKSTLRPLPITHQFASWGPRKRLAVLSSPCSPVLSLQVPSVRVDFSCHSDTNVCHRHSCLVPLSQQGWPAVANCHWYLNLWT